MTEPLTAAQIVKMIHPDLPPATAHFLLNEAKPLLEWIEAQAEELAKYKHLATTAIDDAVALRAKLVPLTAEQIIDAIYKADAQHDIEFMTTEWPVIFARVIEAEHGIVQAAPQQEQKGGE